MRWKKAAQPEPFVGARRAVTRFAWKPIEITKGSVSGPVVYVVWLGFYIEVQEYVKHTATYNSWKTMDYTF
jgi:hypothetical protein